MTAIWYKVPGSSGEFKVQGTMQNNVQRGGGSPKLKVS